MVGTGSGRTGGEPSSAQRQGLLMKTRGGAASVHTDALGWADGRGARARPPQMECFLSAAGSKVINRREWLYEVK